MTVPYWYVYCSPCDWTGPQRESFDEAYRDREEHIDKHEMGRLGVHIREDVSEEIV